MRSSIPSARARAAAQDLTLALACIFTLGVMVWGVRVLRVALTLWDAAFFGGMS